MTLTLCNVGAWLTYFSASCSFCNLVANPRQIPARARVRVVCVCAVRQTCARVRDCAGWSHARTHGAAIELKFMCSLPQYVSCVVEAVVRGVVCSTRYILQPFYWCPRVGTLIMFFETNSLTFLAYPIDEYCCFFGCKPWLIPYLWLSFEANNAVVGRSSGKHRTFTRIKQSVWLKSFSILLILILLNDDYHKIMIIYGMPIGKFFLHNDMKLQNYCYLPSAPSSCRQASCSLSFGIL